MREQTVPVLQRIPWRHSFSWRTTVIILLFCGSCYLLFSNLLVGFLHHRCGLTGTWSLFGGIGCSQLLVLGLLWHWLSRDGSWRNFCRIVGIRRLRRRDWIGIPGYVLLIGVLEWVVSLPWRSLLDALRIPYAVNQEVVTYIRDAWLHHPALFGVAFLTLVVLTPWVEELLFRRLLFGVLRPFGGIAATVLTALLFGGVHFFLLGFPALTLMGLVFQWSYLRSRNLLISVAIHTLVNLIALVGAAAGVDQF